VTRITGHPTQAPIGRKLNQNGGCDWSADSLVRAIELGFSNPPMGSLRFRADTAVRAPTCTPATTAPEEPAFWHNLLFWPGLPNLYDMNTRADRKFFQRAARWLRLVILTVTANLSVKHVLLTTLILISLLKLQAAESALSKPAIGTLPAAKILFLGNSITLHGPAPDIGWTGNWGMAASAEEKDYVHLLAADIAKASGAQPRRMVRNLAGFERGYDTFDLATELKAELEFNADIIIVAIGENVSQPASDEARAKFAAAFARLLAALQRHGQPAIFVRSSFWPNATKDEVMRKASAEAGASFVDLAELGRDETNAARSERNIKHAGVAGHPGDKGMRAIADAIFAAIQKRGSLAWPKQSANSP